jgi:hypothetical protein
MEPPMQDDNSGRNQQERRVIRTWRISVVAFYGSIMAIMILLATIGERTTQVAASQHSTNIQEATAPR